MLRFPYRSACSFRRCASFIVLFHVGGTIYKRQHRGKYLYRRTVFRHVRNFGGSPMSSYFRYEMGYVALPGEVEIKESGGARLCMYVRPRVYAKFIREMKDLRSLECNWMNDEQAGIPCTAAPYCRTVYVIRRYTHTHTHTHPPRAVAYYFGTVHIIFYACTT